jgi:hypothetical protein
MFEIIKGFIGAAKQPKHYGSFMVVVGITGAGVEPEGVTVEPSLLRGESQCHAVCWWRVLDQGVPRLSWDMRRGSLNAATVLQVVG